MFCAQTAAPPASVRVTTWRTRTVTSTLYVRRRTRASWGYMGVPSSRRGRWTVMSSNEILCWLTTPSWGSVCSTEMSEFSRTIVGSMWLIKLSYPRCWWWT